MTAFLWRKVNHDRLWFILCLSEKSQDGQKFKDGIADRDTGNENGEVQSCREVEKRNRIAEDIIIDTGQVVSYLY